MVKKRKTRRGRIIDEGLVPDTDPIYERGWITLTGRNLSRNLPREKRLKVGNLSFASMNFLRLFIVNSVFISKVT